MRNGLRRPIGLNAGRGLRGELNVVFFVCDEQSRSRTKRVSSIGSAGIDFQNLRIKNELKPKPFERERNSRSEAEPAGIVAHAGKPVDKDHPDPSHRRDVASVLDIAGHIAKIHECGHPGIVYGLFHVSDFRRHDALNARRKRRIAGGQGIVEFKVSFL